MEQLRHRGFMRNHLWIAGIFVLLLNGSTQAEVVGVEIRERGPFADGHEFGRAGAYEKIVGRLHEVVGEAKASGMTRKEIADVVEVSMATDTSPYSATPSSVTALAKKKSGK